MAGMELFILRHAEAADFYPDAERPLTTRGREQAGRLGAHLKHVPAITPAQVWVSPYVRAQQTWQYLQAAREADWPMQIHSGLTPEDDPLVTLAEIRACGLPSLMLIGHNPHLTFLSCLLQGQSPATRPSFYLDKASLVHFQGRVGTVNDTDFAVQHFYRPFV